MLWKEYEDVLLEREDNVATILLNNPANMNPVTVSTMDHLVDALTLCEEDDTVRVIVLRGAGGNFSAGGNVKGMKERLDKGINTTKEGIRAGGEFMMRLRTINKPTIAWIEGAAAGADMSMALCCDFALAAEDAKMVFAFVNIGFVPDCGITHMLTKNVGRARATDLLMGGRRFTGADAAKWGMITAAAPKEELEDLVKKYIKKYSQGPAVAYAQIKRMINSCTMRELNACMQEEVEAQFICSKTEDYRIAVEAFCEKKKPEFVGR